MDRLSKLDSVSTFSNYKSEFKKSNGTKNVNQNEPNDFSNVSVKPSVIDKYELEGGINPLKDTYNKFSESVNNLTETLNFAKVNNVSSNNENKVVIITKSNTNIEEEQKLNVEVKAIAKEQVNRSKINFIIDEHNKINNLSRNPVFRLESEDIKADISVQINGDESINEIFNKTANAINEANTNFIGKVVPTNNEGEYLEISSVKTGEATNFKISDVRGNIVSELGLDNIQQIPVDALYSVNGEETKTNSNKVVINDGIQIELLDIGLSEITIKKFDYKNKIKGEEEQITNCVKDAVDSINQVGKNIDVFYQKSNSALANLGINLSDENKLIFDKEFLNSKLNTDIDTVVNAINCKNGMFDFLNLISNNVLNTQPKLSDNSSVNAYYKSYFSMNNSNFSDSF